MTCEVTRHRKVSGYFGLRIWGVYGDRFAFTLVTVSNRLGDVLDGYFVVGASGLELVALAFQGNELLAEVELPAPGEAVRNSVGHGFLGPLAAFPLDGFWPLVDPASGFGTTSEIVGQIRFEAAA